MIGTYPRVHRQHTGLDGTKTADSNVGGDGMGLELGGTGNGGKGKYDQNTMYGFLKNIIKSILKKVESE